MNGDKPVRGEAPWPIEADPLTQLIQRLNSAAYNLTKEECIAEARKLRSELAINPPSSHGFYDAQTLRREIETLDELWEKATK